MYLLDGLTSFNIFILISLIGKYFADIIMGKIGYKQLFILVCFKEKGGRLAPLYRYLDYSAKNFTT